MKEDAVSSTFNYNRKIEVFLGAGRDFETLYSQRSYELVQSLAMVESVLEALAEDLVSREVTPDSPVVLRMLDSDATAEERAQFVSVLNARYQKAEQKCLKNLAEIKALKRYFAITHCLNATDERLEFALKVFKGSLDRCLHQIANTNLSRLPNGQIGFGEIESALCHLIQYRRCIELIGKFEELPELEGLYPFDVFD